MTKTKLQIMREKKGLTVEQLAEKIVKVVNDDSKDRGNIMYVAMVIRKYELGNSTLNLGIANKNIEIMAQALGCSVDELVEE